MTDFVTGITRIVETQEKIVATTAESNLHLQLQTASNEFYLPMLEDAFGTCANSKVNRNNIIAVSLTLADDADPFAVSLLQALEQPTSLKDKGVIDFTIILSAHHQAWKTQKDKPLLNQVSYLTATIFCRL